MEILKHRAHSPVCWFVCLARFGNQFVDQTG
jgi:hypothetical protein